MGLDALIRDAEATWAKGVRPMNEDWAEVAPDGVFCACGATAAYIEAVLGGVVPDAPDKLPPGPTMKRVLADHYGVTTMAVEEFIEGFDRIPEYDEETAEYMLGLALADKYLPRQTWEDQ
jgi:hypothetical protein